jgi:hypothetical protein
MAEQKLTLNAEESQYLVDLLEKTLKETEVEEHRTRAPSYRQHIIHWEDLAKGILKKLRQPASSV